MRAKLSELSDMNNSPVTVVVVIPQGAGKTRHATALAERFGCTSIVDEWDGRSDLPPGALALTNVGLAELVNGNSEPLARAG